MRFKYIIAGVITIACLACVGVQAQVNQNSPWPMFRHDTKHTGRSPYTGPGQPVLQWKYPTNDGVASSPSIGPDGTIYVGSGWFYLQQTDSALYALNPDGTLKWKFKAGGGIFSSPAIDQDGTIYFGSFDRKLHAVEDSVTYGKEKWNYDVGHWIMNSPLIADDGTVYFGSLNFKFVALHPDGTEKWEEQVGWCVFSSPIFDDAGHVIVGSKDHNLYCYNDLDTGFTHEWVHPIGTFYDGHLIDCSPAIGPDGTIYFGADQYGASGHSVDPIPIDTSFYAVNPDGSLKWLYVVGDGVESSPGIGPDGTIYFGSYDSTFYALRDDGTHPTLKWSYKTNGVVDASPTIGGDGTIYIGSRDSTLYAFNPDGTILWTYEADGEIESSVTIDDDGVIYFGGMEGAIYALGNPSPDVGPTAIDIPKFVSPDASVTPTVTARNYRASDATFDLAVDIELNAVNVYSDTVTVSNLAGGDSVDVGFATWMVGPDADDIYDINVSTIMGGDLNDNNDTLFATASTGTPYICGDANDDGNINIFDITYIISYLYLDGPPPNVLVSADVNHDGNVNIFDITYTIAFLYLSGPAPDCP
jgi:outer membrane protein assembly factor BamB